MDSSQQKISYNAFAILNRNGDNWSPDQAPIIRGAVETICNHIEGVNCLAKVEYVIVTQYIAKLHETEHALANMIVMTRPKDQMSKADTQFQYLITILADAEVEKEMIK
ncbi:unnamed protein product [Fusarium venenatum]|uniref:Uncharacterized protein n=1 Tax=Fusarium venenatum TaxID=56646 RepID=A0A2L2SWX6_9HYPO|nr:uncharacterized protein FVRRES_06768 [Fusarium venenatum]CEI62332.1 unnamed protein product [Fusarium venenatum]